MSDKAKTDKDRRIDMLWRAHGADPPERADGGPPVDRELLLARLRGELPAGEASVVDKRILKWRAWSEALSAVALADYRQRGETS